ncbi:DNA-binding response regulator [Alicyclobacillus hesperidum]|uniref:DNA-binding response regulator n=1 Tax=Alicyclobacillus hesperidum TaxID=89784 RepID=A0A1H2QDR2_9BACL|nr:response regulator transcription factor [Alicyclobacillus hesperidum]GLV12683.1 DNA-binding response regulator [Alicyclobacillus hesperidum]SDW05286.1 DNA-binding response regulator, OmpR family, contains REC and winged-helix (wHTH) domain [Alicyclobacillus hesperidum]
MRILLVEDEARLASALKQLLKENQYAVDTVHDGDSGYDLALTDSYDIVILDIMLPKMSGIDILRGMRENGVQTPVLLLTAKDTVEDRVTGLDAGADDYLVKPFDNKELLARVRALSRRTGQFSGSDAIEAGPFRLDFSTRTVTRNGEALALTAKEFQLLELFMRNQNKVLSKEIILDRVWGPDADVIGNAVENYVHFLRKKIDESGKPSYIATVRGVGYLFQPDASEAR